jgi:hypothetical protein
MRLRTVALTLLLAGCGTTYSLTLMPRTSGQQFFGEAVSAGGDEADVSIVIGERSYKGTWVVSRPPPHTGIAVGGAVGPYWRGMGTTVTIDAQAGTDAKALLRSSDGAGLRCDFRGVYGSSAGGGTCQDDQGLVYDVQIRTK